MQQILNWPGTFETFRKIPTCLVYDAHGNIVTWGLQAKNLPVGPDMVKCEWFKLFLEPKAMRDESNVDPRLPQLPVRLLESALGQYLTSCVRIAR